jgi:steroid delta-isomerase-like uncharacterized protein
VPANTDTSRANIELMRNAFAAMNRKDLDACVALLTPDFSINLAGAPYAMSGPRAWRRNAEILFSAFPDIQLHVEDMFAADDKVAVRVRLKGTHTGEFLGNPPTGNKIEYESNELYRIADGKFTEEWICSDMLTLMSQIGAIPAKHLLLMYLAGFRVWFAAGIGLAAGALLMLLARFIVS